jgi:DNA-binding beta-propeller fold protein YncE
MAPPEPPDPPTSSTAVATSTTLNVYAGAAAGELSPATAAVPAYVYVPSNDTGTVTVIDQASLAVVRRFRVGRLVQHVVPSWDLTHLYALASGSNRIVPIDPVTAQPGRAIHVDAPYNLYFSPDGTQAIVMAERRNTIDVYDPHTWQLIRSVSAPCDGNNHADWSQDLSFFLVTCEFSGQVLKIDTATDAVIGVIDLPAPTAPPSTSMTVPASVPQTAMPQDVRLAPDGAKFYVADMASSGVWIIDEDGTAVVGHIATGVGAHGIYPSRDGRLVYVSNRGRVDTTPAPSQPGQGTVSVIDPSSDTVTATWSIPGGGSPDMGGVSADGTRLWLSGRYDSVVYVFDTATGDIAAIIPVPPGPHGLCVFPQPGRYSLGHTGNDR